MKGFLTKLISIKDCFNIVYKYESFKTEKIFV